MSRVYPSFDELLLLGFSFWFLKAALEPKTRYAMVPVGAEHTLLVVEKIGRGLIFPRDLHKSLVIEDYLSFNNLPESNPLCPLKAETLKAIRFRAPPRTDILMPSLFPGFCQ